MQSYCMCYDFEMKNIPEVLVEAIVDFYEDSNSSINLESDILNEFNETVSVHYGFVAPPLIFTCDLGIIMEKASIVGIRV